jgi:hypothetical protein
MISRESSPVHEQAVLGLLVLIFTMGGGCGQRAQGPPETAKSDFPGLRQPDTVITFFYLVNRANRDIRARVRADGREVIDVEIPHQKPPAGATHEAPPPSPYPARELKVSVSPATRRLDIEEVSSEMREQVDITGFSRGDAGFRIIFEEGQIRLRQDYLPIR